MAAGRTAAVWVLAGLLGLAPTGQKAGASPKDRAPGERTVSFALDAPATVGGEERRRTTLTISFTGERDGQEEIVALVEGTLLARMMVPMERGSGPAAWQISLRLDPPAVRSGQVPAGDAASGDQAHLFHRLDISFARIKGMGLVPLLKRSVYLNLEPRPERKPGSPPSESPPTEPEPPKPATAEPSAESPPLPGIERPSVAPVLDEVVAETEIAVPKPKPVSPDYWEELTQRITAKFGQRLGSRPAAARPRVQFRLYWDGVPQVIFLERTSGSPLADQAGLDSVMDAQPFPPFPPTVTGPFVDVHVDFAKAPKPSRPRAKR
ncbi:MAG: TonB C-terminal domain-containing protein [Nitrospirota bacterium]